jgi:hypothetical protein
MCVLFIVSPPESRVERGELEVFQGLFHHLGTSPERIYRSAEHTLFNRPKILRLADQTVEGVQLRPRCRALLEALSQALYQRGIR